MSNQPQWTNVPPPQQQSGGGGVGGKLSGALSKVAGVAGNVAGTASNAAGAAGSHVAGAAGKVIPHQAIEWKDEKAQIIRNFKEQKKNVIKTIIVGKMDQVFTLATNAIGNTIKKKIKDPYMPTFVENLCDDVVDTFWPDVTQEAKDIIITGLGPKVVVDQGEKPCFCGGHILAFFRYYLMPFDRSGWRQLRNPLWWIFLILTLIPKWGIGIGVRMLYLFIQDCGDAFMMQQYILDFKALMFINLGVVSALTGSVQYYICLSKSPQDCDVGAPQEELISLILFIGQIFFVWVAFMFLRTAKRKGGSKFQYDQATRKKMEAQANNSHGMYEAIANDWDKPVTNQSVFVAPQAETEDVLAKRSVSRLTKFLIWDMLVFILCLVLTGMVFFFNKLDPSAEVETSNFVNSVQNWKVTGSLYWIKAFYGLMSFPFVLLELPVINQLISHAKPTGFNRWGNTVPYTGEEEEDTEDKKKKKTGKNDGALLAFVPTHHSHTAAAQGQQPGPKSRGVGGEDDHPHAERSLNRCLSPEPEEGAEGGEGHQARGFGEKLSGLRSKVPDMHAWRQEKMQMLREFKDEKKNMVKLIVIGKLDNLFILTTTTLGEIIKKNIKDPYMPQFVKNICDDLVDSLWPDITAEAKDRIVSGLAPKIVIDQGPDPCCCGGHIVAFFRYYLMPYDRSSWRQLRNPLWWIFLLLTLIPTWGIGMGVRMLYLFIQDCKDSFMMQQYILDFKALMFINLGVVSALIGSVRYYICLSETPSTCTSVAPQVEIISMALFVGQIFFVWAAAFFLRTAERKGGYHYQYDRASRKKMEDEAAASGKVFAEMVADPTKKESVFVKPQAETEELLAKRSIDRLTKFLIWDMLIFFFCVVLTGLVFFFNKLDPQAQVDVDNGASAFIKSLENWKVTMSLFWIKAFYGLMSFPFVLLELPVINTLISHAKPTGFNRKGNTVPFTGESEDDVQKKEAARSRNLGGPEEHLLPHPGQEYATTAGGGDHTTNVKEYVMKEDNNTAPAAGGAPAYVL